MPDTSVYLKNYKAPAFTINTVDLDFALYDDHALVQSTLTLERRHEGALCLQGEALELVSISLNGLPLAPYQYALNASELRLECCPDVMTLEIVTKIYPQNNTKLSGLYRSNNLFCTQCEAEGFRRITYFLDRPDVLASYSTRIVADKAKYPVLLSNGNLIEQGDLPDGRHWALWKDPFKKPSYLFAVVAGHLACVRDSYTRASGAPVDLRIYVEPGNEDKCQHAMNSLKNAMRWDEQVYGLEYDLDVFMIVAVSDFNMGAMENKGLNIFNSKYILARPDTATDQDFAGIESVVAHEYFHNWTGNRVTCRDWFQLSLKEGLTVFRDQEFSRDMNSPDVNRIRDVNILRITQFPEDAGSMAHPVQPQSYQEINNFYTATIYNKGAEVIRMQHTLLGEARYRKGMDLYFQRHDGQAVTIDDFVAAMADASGIDLNQFKRWYTQAGTPELSASTSFCDGTLRLRLKQTCKATPECHDKKPFHIPVRIALFDSKGAMLPIEPSLLELKEPEQDFVFSGLSEKPIVSLLRDFSAPVTLTTDLSQEDHLFLLRHESNGYAKWNAAQRVIIACIHDCLKRPSTQWSVPEALSAALEHILLDESLDMSLRAQLLMPPAFEEVIASLQHIDVMALEAVRDYFRKQIGLSLYESAAGVYKNLWDSEDHQMNGKAYGRRALRNVCLWLMMKANEAQSLTLCQTQFDSAQTMTDQLAAFALLVHSLNTKSRNQAINTFYTQWSDNELVLDKWFAIQATCEHSDTLNHVRQLMQHEAFSMKNPNKVRALIGAFCQANPRNFHAPDGSAYTFLSDTLIKLDAINPQIAARLATPFTYWTRYDLQRQHLIKTALERLNDMDLSKDLRELVVKSLAAKS